MLRKMLTLLFCLFVVCGHAAEHSYTTIEDRAHVKILNPRSAERKTAKIKLENGLEAFIVSDPSAIQSGAVMVVKAGSWEDPEQYPGIAHFLEHMLFLGTQKYPNESEFSRFITENGGQNNAFTSNTTTSFLFTVNSEAFGEALDRFSDFFKEPLFNPSGVTRELKAIDQEYAKNIEDDRFRNLFVYKELMNPKNPLHHFNAGNSSTLKNVSRETLQNWYKNHYSADLMRLVVYSSFPLDNLIELVVNEFSDIPNRHLSSPVIEIPAFKPEDTNKIVYIEPFRNMRALTLIWELPPKLYDMKDEQPDTMVCYVLGAEGEKSLLAELRKESLAEGLSCGSTRQGEKIQHFYLEIDLTTLGLRNIDTVITRTFQAIKNLREKGFPLYLFEEIQNIARTRYQYQSIESEFDMLMVQAQMIQGEDLATYPEQTLVPQKYSPQVIKEFINYLTPQNVHLFVTAPSKETGVAGDHTEKWVGGHYAIQTIPQETIAKWSSVPLNPEIGLPPPNAFIATNLSLVNERKAPSAYQFPEPKPIVDNEFAKIYFAPDNYYLTPTISWTLEFRTPSITMEDPEKIVFGDLVVKYIEDALVKYSYPALIAGLEYNIERTDNGIKLELNGYSEKASLLLTDFLNTLNNLKPDPDKFPIFKDSLLRQYQNTAKESPLEQGLEQLKSILYEHYVTDKQKAAALRNMTFETFSTNFSKLWENSYVEGIFYGNMTENEAKNLSEQVIKTFQKGSYPPDKQYKPRILLLPQDEGPFYFESQAQVLGNAVILAIEEDTFSFKKRAAQHILMQAIKEPFFSALRTKQQTGYIVSSLGQEIERKLFDLFFVQSNTHDVRDLLSRFETFIESYVQELGVSELKEEQFNNLKKALLEQLQQPLPSMKTMGALLGMLALKYDGDFNWIAKRIEGMQNLTYAEFLDLAVQTLGKQNKRRIAMFLKGELPAENTLIYTKARSWNMLRNTGRYESREH